MFELGIKAQAQLPGQEGDGDQRQDQDGPQAKGLDPARQPTARRQDPPEGDGGQQAQPRILGRLGLLPGQD